MKVYVAFEYEQHEGIGRIHKVFDSKNKAEDFIKINDYYDFKEFDLE